MTNMKFPLSYDNETAHYQVKLLMMQKKQLSVKLTNEPSAMISTYPVTRLRYQLNDRNWEWLLNYLQTGDYEDWGVFPSDLSLEETDWQRRKAISLIEDSQKLWRVQHIRETPKHITLIGIYKYGKVFFSIKRDDEFLIYLHNKGI